MKITSTGGAGSIDWSDGGGDSNVATVQDGEHTLAQVAERLGVNADDLQSANPQIADPLRLTAGQEIRLPSSTAGTPKETAADASQGGGNPVYVPDMSKRMDSSLGGDVMRALLNFGAIPIDNPGPGGTTPVSGHSPTGTAAAPGKAPAGSTPDALQALTANADFKNLSEPNQTLVKQTLTGNPPVTGDKVQKTIDLLGASKGLPAADQKLVLEGFQAAKGNPAYADSLKKLVSDPKFTSLTADEKVAVLSQTKNYPDSRSVDNIDRMLHKDWFTSQDLGDKQRSLKTVARLSQYPPNGDATIIGNTLNKFLSPTADYKLEWKSLHVDSGTTYGTGANKVLTLNKDLIDADNAKMPANATTNHLVLNTVSHEVNHLVNDDKVEDNFKYFQAEYRAWYVGFKAEHGRVPTNQEAMEQRIQWQLDPASFYGKHAAEAMKVPAEAQKFYDFLGSMTGKTVDAHNWQTVMNSDPSTWPGHKSSADAPAPAGNSDNH